MPDHLHWFYWESYSTWLTGFGLFTVLFLFNSGTFLVDKRVFDWTAGAAIAASLEFPVVCWFVYDIICRMFGRRKNGDLIVGLLLTLLVAFASWLACQLFAGRAAFLLVGPIYGWRAKQRSVHNTYFTLPVLIAMMSIHYGWLYQGPNNWLVLVLLMLAGALIRHSFVARQKALVQGKRVPWEHALVGVITIVGLAIWIAPAPPSAAANIAATRPVSFAEVESVIDQRCTLCHNAQLPSKNIALHTPEMLASHAQQIYQQVAVLKLMPMNNATHTTDDEGALIKRWFEVGAPQN